MAITKEQNDLLVAYFQARSHLLTPSPHFFTGEYKVGWRKYWENEAMKAAAALGPKFQPIFDAESVVNKAK